VVYNASSRHGALIIISDEKTILSPAMRDTAAIGDVMGFQSPNPPYLSVFQVEYILH
jgi:hypothetical protein